MPRPLNEAPLPPWRVERTEIGGFDIYLVLGGRRHASIEICRFNEAQFSNAKELADLIVQRTKQS